MDKQQHYAQAYQVAPDQVTSVRLELAALKQSGTLVDITVAGLSQLHKRVTWKELGVPEQDQRAKQFTRGTKALFPEDLWRPLQSTAVSIRRNLERHSYDLDGFAPYRYVPVSAYFVWREKHDELAATFYARKQKLLDAYTQVAEQMRETFTRIAEEAWDAIRSRVQSDVAREIWIDTIVSNALGQLPSYDELDSRLQVSYRVGMIQDRLDIEQDLAKADELAMQRYQRHADLEKLELMKQIEHEQLRKQFESMASPFAQVMTQLHAQINQDVQDLLAVVQKHGCLPWNSAEKARGVKTLYDLMATTRMPDLEAKLEQLDAAINAAAVVKPTATSKTGGYAPDAIAQALVQIASVTHDGAQAAAHAKVSRAATIDI